MITSSLTQSLLKNILTLPSNQLPNLVILNSGAWLLKDCYDSGTSLEACTKIYTELIHEIKPALQRLSALTKVVWTPQTTVDRRFATLFLSASQNGAISVFNQIASCLLADTAVLFWWTYAQVYDFFGDSHDGLHQGRRTLFTNAQILLNLACNKAVGSNASYCCIWFLATLFCLVKIPIFLPINKAAGVKIVSFLLSNTNPQLSRMLHVVFQLRCWKLRHYNTFDVVPSDFLGAWCRLSVVGNECLSHVAWGTPLFTSLY